MPSNLSPPPKVTFGALSRPILRSPLLPPPSQPPTLTASNDKSHLQVIAYLEYTIHRTKTPTQPVRHPIRLKSTSTRREIAHETNSIAPTVQPNPATIPRHRTLERHPGNTIIMAPMKQKSNYDGSNHCEGVVPNVLATCYIADTVGSLKGLHYCSTGANGTFGSP